MKLLVTGSSGHLGEALIRSLGDKHQILGVDIKASTYTTHVGSISDPNFIDTCMTGVTTVYHTATLHKPHVATHSKQQFIDTNVTGALVLLEAAVKHKVKNFIFTSTTSLFGDALRPPVGEPAAWVTEAVAPIPKNIYGVTKNAAEDLCLLFHRLYKLNCIILRTSRFFLEDDDDKSKRETFSNDNNKVNELMFRRADIADMVSAHLQADAKAASIGFGKYIISGSSPFTRADLVDLRIDSARVLRKYFPQFEPIYASLGWKMQPSIDRVYVNRAAQDALDWQPKYTFEYALSQLAQGLDYRSPLSIEVGSKGYHEQVFRDGPYPVEPTP